jgi:hypothetical protein
MTARPTCEGWGQLDWFKLRQAVCNAAPDLNPPPMHWLESDASASYCRRCIMTARGAEFDLGTPLADTDYYQRDEWEDAFWEGIGSYPHRQAGTSDVTETCYLCGVTLAYWLTDAGIKEELHHWSDAVMSGDLSEIAYNLDRLFECADEDQQEVRALAIRFLEYAHHQPREADHAATNSTEGNEP